MSHVFDHRRPPHWVGVAIAIAIVVATTLALFPLREVAPVLSLSVVYLLGVLVVSSVWGAWLGVAASVVSAGAFNFFHIAPTGRFTIAESENWVALAVFLVAAIGASSVGQAARHRSLEADQRRREADLAAEMARLLLRGERLNDTLPSAAHRLAQSLGLPSAAIEPRAVEGDERRLAFPLREGARQTATLLVPADAPGATLRQLQERIVPSLEALLVAAFEREQLQEEVIENVALRRADVIKTGVLRSVSHDLRSPLTAILTSAHALGSAHLSEPERQELAEGVAVEATRLSRLIDNLLDLSRLEAHAAEPRREWCSVEEVIRAAVDDLNPAPDTVRLSVARDLPPVRADAVQLERAFSNLIDNAVRHSGGHPVSVRARDVGGRILVRVVDRGPGIPPAQLSRVFEPFYRSGSATAAHRGSGLGLAIVRGFIEANGGRVWAESLPGQGTTFVVELPLEAPAPTTAPLTPPAPSVEVERTP